MLYQNWCVCTKFSSSLNPKLESLLAWINTSYHWLTKQRLYKTKKLSGMLLHFCKSVCFTSRWLHPNICFCFQCFHITCHVASGKHCERMRVQKASNFLVSTFTGILLTSSLKGSGNRDHTLKTTVLRVTISQSSINWKIAMLFHSSEDLHRIYFFWKMKHDHIPYKASRE